MVSGVPLAKLEADHQRGIPFNEAIGNDSLGLDIMARGVLQDCNVKFEDWIGGRCGRSFGRCVHLLPTTLICAGDSKMISGLS